MTIDTSREAVERLLENVTPGPWDAESGHEQQNGQLYWQVTDGRDAIMQNQFCWCQGDQAANARFIAASRELVPALLAERDAALAEVARLSTPPDDAEVAELVNALRTQRQIDMDGCEVAVSRQACDMAADALTRLSHAHAARRKE